ncbi:MAG: hypothetical protein JHC66_06045 [Acidimicrobiia bacterium]|nr:hypothetical protein [Acidimicrobiia bacterium]
MSDRTARTHREAKSRRGRVLLAWSAGLLSMILLAEGVTRVIENRLPEPADWFSPASARLVREMDQLQEQNLRSRVTIVGSSMPGRDLVPSALARGLADTSKITPSALEPSRETEAQTADPLIKNLSVGGGGQTTVVERWLLEEVVPRIHPQRIIWGVSSLDFNAARRKSTIERYNKARQTRVGALADADQLMASFSALAKNRAALRDPYDMLKVVTGADLSTRLPDRSQPRAASFDLGYKPLPPAKLKKMQLREIAYARDVQLRGYSLGRDELDAFRRTLRRLKALDTEAAVVLMPVTQGYIDAHPHGARDFNAWRTRVTAVAKSEGVAVLDRTRSMPDSAFRDAEHLLVASARDFSLEVATELKRQGW